VGLQLVGQSRAGVLVRQSRGPVVVTGFRIESPASPDAAWRAVLLNSSTGPAPGKDNAFAGEDGVFILHGSGRGAVVVESGGCDVALRNVFFAPGAGNATLFAAPRFGVAVPRGGPAPLDPAWALLARLAFTASGGSVWDAGANASAPARAVTAYVAPPGVARAGPPPAGLAAAHSWAPDGVPAWAAGRGAGLLDAAAFGATPAWVNATDDDGAAIQAALDEACAPGSPAFGLPVFLPHGEYGLYRPLQLRGGCARLVGAGSHSAWMGALPAAPAEPAACWDGAPAAPLAAMLVSAPAAPAEAPPAPGPLPLLSDFGLVARPLCPFLDLRSGAGTLLRDVCVAQSVPPPSTGVPPSDSAVPPTEPLVALSGAAWGRFFGLSLDLIFGGNDGASPAPGPRHVLLLVNGTGGPGGGPVHFYQLSTEHKPLPKAVLVAGAAGVHVHAWKSESVLYEPHTGGAGDTQSLVWLVDAENVTLFGHSGNFREVSALGARPPQPRKAHSAPILYHPPTPPSTHTYARSPTPRWAWWTLRGAPRGWISWR
jgi:hypothetical protein